MNQIAAPDGKASRRHCLWRFMIFAPVLLALAGIAGLLMFSWLSSVPISDSATAAPGAGTGEPTGTPHLRIRF
jgi:hypothetical protein